MKKLSFITLGACLALAACGGEAETPADDANTETASETTETATETETESESEEETTAEAEPSAEPTEAALKVAARPVRYGIDGPNYDSCGSVGDVTGLKADGDNFLSVRAAPSTSAKELDRLPAGKTVAMCDSTDGWVGIVYDLTGSMDCGTGSPIDSEQNYGGPCKSGWVSKKFITLTAG